MPLSLEQAETVIEVAQGRARERGITICVAVVDEGGFLIALGRMDGAPPLSARIAEAKAVGAALWHKEGAQLAAVAAENPTFVDAVSHLAKAPLLPGLGSALIRDGQRVLGAAGASGASGEDDLACVEAGIATVLGTSRVLERSRTADYSLSDGPEVPPQ